MPAVGGSIESVTLDGRSFPVSGDVEAQRKLGGFENEVQANGDGTARLIKTRVPLSITGLAVETDDARGDQEFIQALANRNDFFPIGIAYADGSVYQGTAQINSEIQASSQNSATTFDLSGPGILTRQ